MVSIILEERERELSTIVKVQGLDEDVKESAPAPEAKPKEASDIPDGGYGWVIMITAFIARVVMSGVYVTFAIFSKEYVEEFKISPGTMSWMISIYSGLFLVVAPIATLLHNKFGLRLMTIIPLAISAAFYMSTYLYSPFWYTFLTGSIIVGFGHGISHLCASVIITKYFNRRMPIAMGFYSCGSGAASFLITPLVTIFINNFGWRITRVLYGVFYFIAILSVLSFRPIETKKEEDTEDQAKENNNEDTGKVNHIKSIDRINEVIGSRDSNIFNFLSMANIASKVSNTEECNKYFTSIKTLKLNETEIDKNSVNVLNVPIETMVGMSVASNLNLKAAVDQACEQNIEVVIHNEEMVIIKTKKRGGFFKLFTNPIFVIFLVSNLLTSLGFDTPFLYVRNKALELGTPVTQATALLTCMGVGNLIGRLGFGYLGSFKKINVYAMNAFSLIGAGLFVLLGRVAFSFPLMVTYTIGFGVCIGGFSTLGPVLLVHLLPISDFSNGLSILSVVQAVGYFCGAPISGLIVDQTKSYDWPFIYCGIIILLSGSLLFLSYFSKRFRESQREERN